RQHYLGPAEEGRIVKLLYNAVLGTAIASLGEAVAVARKSGLNVDQLLEVIEGSSVASPALKGTMQTVREGRFEPRLTVSLLAKDLRLMNELAASVTAPVPIASSSLQLYEAAANMGWADRDTSAVVLLLQALSGLTGSD
ncbi:MAG: NAD-binding protein, partial [Chloroflexota bacterium]|nr:NAD-binding protein [Chloroflexota bacterium]